MVVHMAERSPQKGDNMSIEIKQKLKDLSEKLNELKGYL